MFSQQTETVIQSDKQFSVSCKVNMTVQFMKILFQNVTQEFQTAGYFIYIVMKLFLLSHVLIPRKGLEVR